MKNWLQKYPDKNYQQGGKISTQGYKRNSPDKNEQSLTIPSGDITMQEVDHLVYGQDNYGNSKMMYPGNDYQFPGEFVKEIPIRQQGGKTNPPIYVTDKNDPRLKSYEDSLKKYNVSNREDDYWSKVTLKNDANDPIKGTDKGYTKDYPKGKFLEGNNLVEDDNWKLKPKRYEDFLRNNERPINFHHIEIGYKDPVQSNVHRLDPDPSQYYIAKYAQPVQPIEYREQANYKPLSPSNTQFPTPTQSQVPLQQVDPFTDANYLYQGNGTFVPDEYHRQMGYPNKTDKMKKGGKIINDWLKNY